MKDKVVIVTGAAAGIGLATARRFAQEGCRVASWDVRDGEAQPGGMFRKVDVTSAASVEAARLRFRPILMTSLAFILGVTPLVVATGAGAEMRQSLGTAVFGGMLGVTAFGLIFTPAFYTLVQRMGFARRQDRGVQRDGPTAASLPAE